jgi:uncharacterized lipoprotein
MRKRKPVGKTLLVLFALLLTMAPGISAYTDQITVKAPDAWQAALKVLKPYGIKKEDPEKMVIETVWIKDTVVRSRGFLKKISGKYYERRYKLNVSITQRDYDTEIHVHGRYQLRPLDARSDLLLWKKIKPTAADYQIEQDVFMNILKTLEIARNSETQNG